MHGGQADLYALVILLAGSFLMPILSGRLHVPSAVLLIGFGLIVGPYGLGLIADSEVISFLSEVGFIVLMFLAGLEIDFNGIRQRGFRPLLVILIICLAIFGLAFLTAYGLGLHPIFGLALGATSVGLPLAVLRELGRLRSPFGQTIILVGSVGEFLTVVGMTLFYFAVRHGFSLQLFAGLGKLLGILLVAGLVLRALMAVAWWQPALFSKLVEQHDGSEIGVRAALLMALAFSTMALLAEVESIVGAFLAGALLAFLLRGKEILEEKLAVVGHGLFVPIFFMVVGMRFDPAAVTWPNLAMAGQLLLAAFLVRLLPGMALVRQGLSLRQTGAAVALLSAPLTLVVAIAAIGTGLGLLDSSGRGTLIVLAVAAGVAYPILFRLLVGGKLVPATAGADQNISRSKKKANKPG